MSRRDTVITFGDEDRPKQRLQHPVAVIFHLAFRAAALVTYLLCTWFTDNFIVSFLLVLFFLSLDFWTVKNITGRLLAGLRWWNVVDEDGKSHWRFESRKDDAKQQQSTEARLFWIALVVCPLLWILFFVMAFFTFKIRWLIIVALGFAMNGANLYGYLRCKWSSRSEVSNYLTQSIFASLLKRAAQNPANQSSGTSAAQ